jgi:uncharacterized protein
MSSCAFRYCGEDFIAYPSGALHWPAQDALLAADLHLGKSDRMARRGGPLLPPFETEATLARLLADLAESGARRLFLLGDSFDDDLASVTVREQERGAGKGTAQHLLARLSMGAELFWITGNHDPAPVGLSGQVAGEITLSGLALRHMAGEGPDISGHYHPKFRIFGQRRAAFLIGTQHLILPAYGIYTGGLDHDEAPLNRLVPSGVAIVTGQAARMIPLAARPLRRR